MSFPFISQHDNISVLTGILGLAVTSIVE